MKLALGLVLVLVSVVVLAAGTAHADDIANTIRILALSKST
jgi:hypothetical protein